MRSLKDWFEYVEKQAKELERKRAIKEEPPKSEGSAPSAPPKGEGVVFDQIYIRGQQAPPEAKGVSFVYPPRIKRDIESKEEVAIKGYKRAKRETREEFLQRLLDPVLTLQETARLLNVCPMTVRRYANKGILPSFRTAGNQRRFRLSAVLEFMEKYGKGRAGTFEDSSQG